MKFLKVAGFAAAILAATSASAQIDFAFTSSDGGDFSSFSFSLPDNFAFTTCASCFTVGPIDTQSSTQYGPVTLIDTHYTFYDDAGFGGFDSDFDVYFGPVLFSGPVSAPVFANGSYQLDTGTLVISGIPVTGDVPEPATWALMLGGFAAAGTMLRRRRTDAVAAA